MADQLAIDVHGLTKRFGAKLAVDHVDIAVPEGDVWGFLGPNGSGKTTALEVIAGLRRPTAGRVELGVPRSSIAYCPDAAEFEPWLTALEVLDLSAALLGAKRGAPIDMHEG